MSIYTKYKWPALLAEAIYMNSAHQRVIGRANTKKTLIQYQFQWCR